MSAKPDYGNWVSKRMIYVFIVLGAVFVVPSFLLWYFAVPAAVFSALATFFAFARYEASSAGGQLQDRIRGLVIENLQWNGEGKALDIGCGNGPLVVELAKKFPSARVFGIDYWGGQWEYSQATCEQNAKIEGVADRAIFQRASAAELPYNDGYFDAVVSNLVFHEVQAVRDKRLLIREALRVLRPGGAFSFQDLFYLKGVYGNPETLVAEMKGWGLAEVELVQTRDSDFIPAVFQLPFMVGTIGLIKGIR